MNKLIIISLFILLSAFNTGNETDKYASILMESSMLSNGQKMSSKATIYINLSNYKIITHYTEPMEYYSFINNKGEVELYYPKKNEVLKMNDAILATQNALIYYFLDNKTEDLGMQSLNFSLSNTYLDGNAIVTEWTPPESMADKVLKVELAHENQVPVFMGYYNAENKLYHKTYFSDYQTYSEFQMPHTIIEINMVSDSDSIVTRTLYKVIKIGSEVETNLFNYKIPENAKLISH